jgi:hypothetical protein
MKTKRILLPFFAFNMALSAAAPHAVAQTTTADDNKTKSDNTVSSATSSIERATQKLWSEFSLALKNAKLKTSVNTPTTSIANGLALGSKYNFESSPSVGGKYSGIDVWDVNISASPEVFGVANTSGVGVGASWSRQITFIQQFDDRMSSIVRLPYDPITKLPTKSDLFFKTAYNKETQKEEPVIKEGTFIGFRAPLTFSVGKGMNISAGAHVSLDVGLSWVLSGEFDVHIFRMKDNKVRVKILAVKDNIKSASVGVNLMGFNQVGKLVVSRLIDTNLIQFNYSASESNLFVSDYIFNLNHQESRDMYDQLVGHKIKSYDVDSIASQVRIANPFAKDSKTLKHLVADLDVLNDTSEADAGKAVDQRRIIRVSTGKNDTQSDTFGLKLNLFKIAKADSTQTKSISKATIFAQEDHKNNSKYILETSSKISAYEWFWLWGEKDVTSTSMLLQATEDFKPQNVLGFQITRTKDDLSMNSKEYSDLKNIFNSVLPAAITANITWPNWDFSKKDSVQNVHIEQDLLFTENLFKSNIQITEESIKNELVRIIKHYGKFRSLPMNLNSNTEGGGSVDPRMKAYQMGDYLNAYDKDWEQLVIPRYLSIVLNANYSVEERYKAYSDLNYNVPLFSEINGILLSRLIPANVLPQVVIARLSLSARNQTASESFYPSREAYNKLNIFREITYQTQFILNRTYDLRNFLKEDGSSYSAEEVLAQRTAK